MTTKVMLPALEGKIFINQEEIIFAKAEGSYCSLYLDNGEIVVISIHLKLLQKMLDPKLYFRSHHSYLCNLRKVKRINVRGPVILEMSNGMFVDVARRRKKNLFEQLETNNYIIEREIFSKGIIDRLPEPVPAVA